MVTTTPSDVYLFFGAALLGGSVGVAGNFFVNALFRKLDDEIGNKKRLNTILFWIGVIMLLSLIGYLWYQFEYIGQFP